MRTFIKHVAIMKVDSFPVQSASAYEYLIMFAGENY